jgi:ribosome-binding protein aMBF1 (putative translation factor)
MTRIEEFHRKWSKNPDYRKAYEELEEEYALAAAILSARASAGLTQAELARKMKTSQSVIARLEAGRVQPSTRTLERLAAATGTKLKITFEPDRQSNRRA